MSKHCRFTAVLTQTLCALLTMASFAMGPSAAFGQTPVPATFVNPIMYDGGAVFSNYSPIPVQAIAAGDFNNDGVPDLITLDSNANANGWGIMLGRGDGSFQPVASIGTSGVYGEVGSVVVGDFNNDGDLDFAVTYSTAGPDGALSIYLGNGAGGFTLKATYSLLGVVAYRDNSNGLATADLRSNGHLDLLAIDTSNGVDVFLGNGDGTFQPPAAVAIPSPGNSGAEAVGDINHDGKPDLVVASNNSSDGIYVLIGNGDGTFQSPVFYVQGSNSGAMAVAIGQLKKSDDGDVVMGTGNGAYVYMNNGNGTFKTPPVLYGPSWINSVVITDINGDGKNDLVVSSLSSSAVWTMLGNGKGGFTTAGSFATDGYPNNVVVADFNGDKKLDFATSNNTGQWVTVGLGNGDGTFRSSQSYGYTWSGLVSGIATADMNNDGNLDIIEAGGGTGVGITVLLGSSHGVFGSPISTAVGCGQANRGGVNAIALGDVTGDGKVDVVATVANAGGGCPNNEVAVLPGSGKGKFKKPVYYSTGTTQQSYVGGLADFTGDGKLDIVLSNGDGSLSILLNKGKGVYGAANVIVGASGTESGNVIIGDFNHDGKLDIAVTNYSGTAINVLLGNGDGTFQAPIVTPSPINPVGLAAGDFNGDGKLDLALTSWDTGGAFTIFTGNGNGSFTVGNTYDFGSWEACYPSGGANPYWIGAADLNQDGKLDLAMAVQYNYCNTEYSGENTWGAAVVYTGNGDGTFNLDLGPWVGGVNNSGIALGDFNSDGMMDMAVAGNAGWTSQDWVTIMQNNTQPVSVSPLAMTFAAEALGGTSKAQTVLVTNDEKSTLAISKVALAGTDPGDFILKNGCGSSLLSGANCTLTVTFKPTASGTRTATVSITDGAGTQTVSLTGTGK